MHDREKNSILPDLKDLIQLHCHKEITHSNLIHSVFIPDYHDHTRSGSLLFEDFLRISEILRPLTTSDEDRLRNEFSRMPEYLPEGNSE